MLSAFNPHEYSPAQLTALATAREKELERALDTIRSNLTAETMQHLIVSAPRGFGKSFLMRHIQVEAQRIAAAEGLPLAVVLMPEEMPHVKEPETLIQEITRALTGGGGETAQLRWHEDDGEAWDTAISALEAAITEKLGKDGLLVALVENFDQLLRRAFRQDVQAQRLRNLITLPSGRLMLIAASASGAIDRDYDKALFQAFSEIALAPWSVDECMRFFDRQREAAGKPPLDKAASARAKAVASFIGGTPRLATLLGEQLFDEDLLNAADLLRGLIDELTPYYKARIEALPGRSQLLLDALLRGGEPATQSELAQRVKANSQAAIAGPFSDLVRESAVMGVKALDSAEVLYRVADRVFAHYYRRRIIDHGRELCPLEGLVDLLADFYDPEEKQAKALEFLKLGHIAEARVLARLHDVDMGNPKADRRRILDNLVKTFIPLHLIPHATSSGKALLRSIADQVIRDDIDSAYALIADNLNKLSKPQDQATLLLSRVELDRFEGLQAGLFPTEAAIRAALESRNEELIFQAKRLRAECLNFSDRNDEALALQLVVLEEIRGKNNAKNEIELILDISYSLIKVGKFEEARDYAIKAKEIANKSELFADELQSMTFSSLISIMNHDYVNAINDFVKIVHFYVNKSDEMYYKATMLSGNLIAKITAISLARNSNDQANIHSLLSICRDEFNTDNNLGWQFYHNWLIIFTSSVIEAVTDADQLDRWTDAVGLYFSGHLTSEIMRMRAAAEYHRSGRSGQVLARFEPDFAKTIQVMFPPTDPPPEAPPKAKRSGRRRRSP